MALVRTFSSIAFTFRDNNGKVGRAEINLPSTLEPPALVTALTDARTPLLNLTDATLVGASVNISYVEDEPVAAPATSEVERRLVISGYVPAQGRRVILTVPSARFTLEQAYTDVVTGTPIQAVVDYLAARWTGYQFQRAYIMHRNRRPKI